MRFCNQFRTCLGTLKIEMTEAETQELIRRYQLKDGTGLICYRDFVNAADKVFSDEANPSEAIAAAKSSAVSYKSCDFNLNLKEILVYNY